MEYFNSFFQNIKDKLTNPFFGTLIIVLILHHPQFWYSLFNFDDGVNLRQKIVYLREIGYREFSYETITDDILCALSFVFLGYFIIVGTRALSMWIEYCVMPYITKKIVSKNLVSRTEYNEVVKERDEYSEKYEDQRKTVRNMSKDYDTISEEANNKNSQINHLQHEITTLNNKVAAEKSTANRFRTSFDALEKEKSELDSKYEILNNRFELLNSDNSKLLNLFFGGVNTEHFNDAKKLPASIREMVKEMKNDGMWDVFLEVCMYFFKGGSISPEVLIRMKEYGVVISDSKGNEHLSAIGKILWSYQKLFS